MDGSSTVSRTGKGSLWLKEGVITQNYLSDRKEEFSLKYEVKRTRQRSPVFLIHVCWRGDLRVGWVCKKRGVGWEGTGRAPSLDCRLSTWLERVNDARCHYRDTVPGPVRRQGGVLGPWAGPTCVVGLRGETDKLVWSHRTSWPVSDSLKCFPHITDGFDPPGEERDPEPTPCPIRTGSEDMDSPLPTPVRRGGTPWRQVSGAFTNFRQRRTGSESECLRSCLLRLFIK